MTTTIIILICVLLLIAYAFDITSSKTRIPSVILLLLVGWILQQGTLFFELKIPELTAFLPILGTVGLILIVMEGSLELELDKNKLPIVGKATIIAFFPMLIFSFGLAFAIHYFGNVSFKIAYANSIPLAIISSAIAIPSAQNLGAENKEFVTYESSMSDIFGVLLFNFVGLNETINLHSIGEFFIELILTLVITVIATLGLTYLLSKIKHHVKFLPIILMVILIYSIAKIYHLPALIFILLFGLFLGNLKQMNSNWFIQKLQPEILEHEVLKFKELTVEFAFLIRALFFILFGFLINSSELLNIHSISWSVGIVLGIYLLRFFFLKLIKFEVKPLIFIAPRGLITILLFLSIPATQIVPLVNNSLIIQVIILSALIMMVGLMVNKKNSIGKGEIK